jgi:hypothetical protein
MNTGFNSSTIRVAVLSLMITFGAGTGVSFADRGGPSRHGRSYSAVHHRGSYRGHYVHIRPAYRPGFHSPRTYYRFRHTRYWGGFYIGTRWFWGPTVIWAGIPYYYYGGIYYRPLGDELVAATPSADPEPTAAAPAPEDESSASDQSVETTPDNSPEPTGQPSDTVTVNIPNDAGGYSPVKLVKVDNGYIGPQGEFYPDNPTVAELKVLYGK